MPPLIFTKICSDLLEDREKCKRYIELIIQFGCSRTKEMIQKNQHSLVRCDGNDIINLALKNALGQPKFASPDKVSQELSMLTMTKQKEYDTKTKCFFDNVPLADRPYLLVGEEIVSERFTYLEQPFKRFPESTCVFVRQTNLVEYCFLIHGYLFMHSEIMDASCKEVIRFEKPDVPKFRVFGSTEAKDIAKLMGEGLLSGVMGDIALGIVNQIFPPDMTNFLDEVYKEIQRIVHDELTDVVIDQLNGRLHGTVVWIKNTYTPMKDSGSYSDEDLSSILLSEEKDLVTEVIGVLQEERFSKPGICVFMIAAGLHLAILQELAYIDPTTDAADSSFVESIKKYAKDYGDYAKATTDAVVDERLGYITLEYDHIYDYLSHGDYYYWWMKDSFDNVKGQQYRYEVDSKDHIIGDGDAEEHATDDVNERKRNKKADLLEKMSDPHTTADDWYKLIQKPLPQ